MTAAAIINRSFRLPFVRFVLLVLPALVWICPAYCGEIHDAAAAGNLAQVTVLIKSDPDLVSSTDSDGNTPLHWAVFKDRPAVVQLLLDDNADVNAKASNGNTPLHVAAALGYEDIAKLLLGYGADVTARTNKGLTPLQLAVAHDQNAVADLLRQSGARDESSPIAAAKPAPVGSTAAGGAHPAAESPPTSPGAAKPGTRTTVSAAPPTVAPSAHVAAGSDSAADDIAKIDNSAAAGDVAAVTALIAANHALVTIADSDGNTPLHWAALHGQVEVAKLLLADGAKVDAAANNGNTPLHVAAAFGRQAMVVLLLASGADPNAKTNKGLTSEQMAAAKGHPDLAGFIRHLTAPNVPAVAVAAAPTQLPQVSGSPPVSRVATAVVGDAAIPKAGALTDADHVTTAARTAAMKPRPQIAASLPASIMRSAAPIEPTVVRDTLSIKPSGVVNLQGRTWATTERNMALTVAPRPGPRDIPGLTEVAPTDFGAKPDRVATSVVALELPASNRADDGMEPNSSAGWMPSRSNTPLTDAFRRDRDLFAVPTNTISPRAAWSPSGRPPGQIGGDATTPPDMPAPANTDRAPRLGLITVGAFAPEAVPGTNVCLEGLDSDQKYMAYRQAVREKYGADLADMNYLGVGVDGWECRYACFQDWLLRAGKYGDPTIAIEPVGPAGYAAFRDGPDMRALREAFAKAGESGITVWVRFASESNLLQSKYSVFENSGRIDVYRRSVRWFRSYMPSNVRLVFSPLINTAYLQDPRQIHALESMYQAGMYDRIGGTIYATSWLSPKPAFDWYYHFMRGLDRKTPFQICELGGTYARSDEVKAFLVRVARGDWPGVQRVNLFAGDLNSLAIYQHGHFGFVLPGETTSYISDLFDNNAASPRYSQLSSDKELAILEQPRPDDMGLTGTVARLVSQQDPLDLLRATQ